VHTCISGANQASNYFSRSHLYFSLLSIFSYLFVYFFFLIVFFFVFFFFFSDQPTLAFFLNFRKRFAIGQTLVFASQHKGYTTARKNKCFRMSAAHNELQAAHELWLHDRHDDAAHRFAALARRVDEDMSIRVAAASNLVVLYKQQGRIERACMWLEQLYEWNASLESALELGRLKYSRALELGDNETGNLERFRCASKWWRRAASMGSSQAKCWLGILHSQGHGVASNMKRAREWWHDAVYDSAKPIDANAALWLAECELDGGDRERAVELLHIAVEASDASDARALCLLAQVLSSSGGGGGGVSAERVAALYRRAAGLNDPLAMKNYGHCLELGHGVERNESLAKEYYERALNAVRLKRGEQDKGEKDIKVIDDGSEEINAINENEVIDDGSEEIDAINENEVIDDGSEEIGAINENEEIDDDASDQGSSMTTLIVGITLGVVIGALVAARKN
jgi:TPR repeat protein